MSADSPPDPAELHLALVGLMGSGKTSVGRLVATRTGRTLVDTDDLVETVTGRSIAELFASEGEEAFRRYELDSLRRALARSDRSVVATGGGVVTTPEARRALARDSFVVWLDADPSTLVARLASDDARPLLSGRDPLTVLADLHERRAPLYREVADRIVAVDGLEPERVADVVLDVMGWSA